MRLAQKDAYMRSEIKWHRVIQMRNAFVQTGIDNENFLSKSQSDKANIFSKKTYTEHSRAAWIIKRCFYRLAERNVFNLAI